MARNWTTVTEYAAEFKAAPFERPAWHVTRFETQRYEGYAVRTIARDLTDIGWRELDAFDVSRCFPRGKAFGDVEVERAFVTTYNKGGRVGRIMVLTKGR